MPVMKTLVLSLLASSLLLAADKPAAPFGQYQDNQKVAVQNAILAKVNGNTISMMDVKKKMDLMFHQNYPQFANSAQARLQFYEASWRHVVMDLVDHELIIADALDKEIKLTDAEVRENMEERFGPNVMQTLDKIGFSYDEAWKMVKNEMIVQRMSWWFIHAKATAEVTPQDIRQAYRLYLEKNPAYAEWKYRVVTIRVDQPNDALADKVQQFLSEAGKDPVALESELKKFDTKGISVAVSNEFVAKTHELSETHKASLADLTVGTYSKPSFQTNRIDKKTVYRIFYLVNNIDHPAPSFEALVPQLRSELNQKAVAKESTEYLGKLRKKYGFNPDAENALPEDLHPFSLQ